MQGVVAGRGAARHCTSPWLRPRARVRACVRHTARCAPLALRPASCPPPPPALPARARACAHAVRLARLTYRRCCCVFLCGGARSRLAAPRARRGRPGACRWRGAAERCAHRGHGWRRLAGRAAQAVRASECVGCVRCVGGAPPTMTCQQKHGTARRTARTAKAAVHAAFLFSYSVARSPGRALTGSPRRTQCPHFDAPVRLCCARVCRVAVAAVCGLRLRLPRPR